MLRPYSASFRFGDDVTKAAHKLSIVLIVLLGTVLKPILSYSQQDDEPGHSIGKVSVKGDLIVVELDHGALGKANLFDLAGRTVRFTPEGSRYRVENLPLEWDPDFGSEFRDSELSLHNFTFPFSGKVWKSFLVGTTGSIRFGPSEKDV